VGHHITRNTQESRYISAREIVMNTTPPDIPEEVTDIFILTCNKPGSISITDDLEQKGYRVTLFDDSQQLLEALKLGKPNLLICDTTTVGDEGYEICREVKAHNDFWQIPVLVLTGAADLGDLLRVLDCNADNFLSAKSSPGYLPVLIEGVLATPVERQTQELIKTQFKIQHNDRIYVVMAGRRKLLEMLLSSYEIIVGKTRELEAALADISDMSRVTADLEDRVREHTHSIENLNGIIRQRDEKERELHAEIAVKDATLNAKTGEIERLGGDLELNRKRLHDAEERIRAMIGEQENLIASHRAEADDLGQQVQNLKSARESLHMDLGRISDELEEKTNRLAETEETIATVSAEAEAAAKTFREKERGYEKQIEVLLTERDGLTARLHDSESARSEEKSLADARAEAFKDLSSAKENLEDQLGKIQSELATLQAAKDRETARADAAENVAASLHEAKEKSGQEHSQALAESEKKAETLSEDIARLKNDLEESNARAVSAEERVAGLLKELEEASARFARSEETLTKSVDEASARYETVSAALEERSAEIRSLVNELSAANTKNQDLESAIQDLTGLVTRLTREQDTSAGTIQSLKDRLSASDEKNRDLVSGIQALNDQVCRTTSERDDAAERVRALEGDLKALQDQVAEEKARHDSVKEHLATVIQGHESLSQAHTENLQKTESIVATYQQEIEKLKADVEAQLTAKADLEQELSTAVARQKSFEDELAGLRTEKETSERISHSLNDELEIVRTTLETEQKLRNQAESRIELQAREKTRMETDLKNVRETLAQVQESLDRERARRESAQIELFRLREEHDKSQAASPVPGADDTMGREIALLREELHKREARQEALENQIRMLTLEKMHVEQKVEELDTEIQDARTALADEWEDHMNADEQLAAVIEDKQSPAAPGISPVHAVVAKKPDLPVIRNSEPNAVTRFDLPPVSVATIPEKEVLPMEVPQPENPVPDEPAPVTITSVEDLFEPETELPPENPIPENTGDPGSALNEEYDAVVPGEIPGSDDLPGQPAAAPVRSSDPRFYQPTDGISFNRQQWLDLLKWAHHSGALSQDQRMQIVRMGRLIQRGRKLTQKQDEQVREMLSLVQSLGYRFLS